MPSELWLLDVGHGSAAVLIVNDRVVIVDGGQGDLLLRFLESKGITMVDDAIVSHADADHVGGVSLLLSSPDFRVGRVFVNPDVRGTALWDDLVSEMRYAKTKGTRFWLEVTAANPGKLEYEHVTVEVLSPSQELAIRTNRGQTLEAQQVTPNAMSVVVRILVEGQPRFLLGADIDNVGLADLLNSGHEPTADVLVFPHHGGRPGASDPATFTADLMRAVRPSVVVFSIGRGRHNTPRPEVVQAVISSNSDSHILCTQLSEHCALDLQHAQLALTSEPALGASKNACCGGTMWFGLETNDYKPGRAEHARFVDGAAPSALCRWRPGTGN